MKTVEKMRRTKGYVRKNMPFFSIFQNREHTDNRITPFLRFNPQKMRI